jgi:hypothetical protein
MMREGGEQRMFLYSNDVHSPPLPIPTNGSWYMDEGKKGDVSEVFGQ